MSFKTAIDSVVYACHGASYAAGWYAPEYAGPPLHLDEMRANTRFGKALCGEKIALMHSELSETLEGVRKGGQSTHIDGFTVEEEELADALIRICDYAGARRLRLGAAADAKMAYNMVRADHKPEARNAAGGKSF